LAIVGCIRALIRGEFDEIHVARTNNTSDQVTEYFEARFIEIEVIFKALKYDMVSRNADFSNLYTTSRITPQNTVFYSMFLSCSVPKLRLSSDRLIAIWSNTHWTSFDTSRLHAFLHCSSLITLHIDKTMFIEESNLSKTSLR